MARTKLTSDVQEKIVQALGAGNYQEAAASFAGISKATFFAWLDRGRIERTRLEEGEKPRKAESIYLDFVDAVENARAQAQVRHVANITKAGADGTWQASAWWLERSYPQQWGRFNRTEISGPDGGPIETTVSIDDLREKIKLVLERKAD